MTAKRIFAVICGLASLVNCERIHVNQLDNVSLAMAEKHLRIVDTYLDDAPRQTFLKDGIGLLQTFGPNHVGGGDCGLEFCELDNPCPSYAVTPHCRFDVYDNALAAIYYTKRGKLDKAKGILDAFLHYLYPGHAESYSYGSATEDQLPSKRELTLLAASYTDEKARAGAFYGAGVADGATDLGNNAWAGMAFARYAAATGESCYATVAHDIMAVLSNHLGCDDKFGGYMGRMKPYPKSYRSIEHNIDMFAFARMIGEKKVENQARKFVSSMYGKDSSFSKIYVVGTHGKVKCDTTIGKEPVATDAQMWNIAAGADHSHAHARAALSFAMQVPPSHNGNEKLQGMWEEDIDHIGFKGKGKGKKYYGFRFTNWGNGIQWENAASAVIGMVRYRHAYGDDIGVTDKIVKIRKSLKDLLEIYGAVPASVLGGNLNKHKKVKHTDKFPGGSDTGMGWTYLRYPHLASTVWAGFALLQQADEGLPIDKEGNPYAPATKNVPAPSSGTSCLPEKTTQPSSSCSSHPKCSGLGGDCCPTAAGMYLGCC